MEAYVYTYHSQECAHKDERFYRRCRCPKWIYIERSRQRISAKTRSWAEAEKKAERLVASAQQTGQKPTVSNDDRRTMSQAIDDYLKDKRSQGLAEATLYKLEIIFGKQLREFCRKEAIVYPAEMTLAKMQQFRNSWKDAALARKKKQERFVGFFAFCIAHKWMSDNPARELSRVIVKDKPTLPFTIEQMRTLCANVSKLYTDKRGLNGSTPEALRERVMAMVLLLRWAGFRIGDAVSLERTRLTKDGRILLYMAKTGNPVSVLIPAHVSRLLHDLPNSNPKYFFWTGNGLLKSAVADWQRTLRRLFNVSKLGMRCHPHMFRDTFAVELLLAGVPIDQVSMLLGHSSVKITEKHYAPWVRSRQEQLEQSVKKARDADPMAFSLPSSQVPVSIN